MDEKLSEDELAKRLTDAAEQVTVGALYKHYKGGMYKVVGLAILESTNEVCVIYQAQYGQKLMFIRPVSVWVQEIDYQGKILKRFEKV